MAGRRRRFFYSFLLPLHAPHLSSVPALRGAHRLSTVNSQPSTVNRRNKNGQNQPSRVFAAHGLIVQATKKATGRKEKKTQCKEENGALSFSSCRLLPDFWTSCYFSLWPVVKARGWQGRREGDRARTTSHLPTRHEAVDGRRSLVLTGLLWRCSVVVSCLTRPGPRLLTSIDN
jgi:hypothetical protein